MAPGIRAPGGQHWVARAPLSLFAIALGLGGLAIAWRRAVEVLNVSSVIGEGLMAAAAIVFIAVSAVQVVRSVRFPGMMCAEFLHSEKAAMAPTFSMAAAILAGGAARYSAGAAQIIWTIAAAVQILFAFLILRRWFLEPQQQASATPAWFIPIVGTMLLPVVGAPLGYLEASWFFFSVGAVFWLLLMPVMVSRLLFGGSFPLAAQPTLFIFLAPAAVGGLAVLALNAGAANAITHVLFGFGSFMALLLVSMLNRIVRSPFSITWWALTYPVAAYVSFVLAYAGLYPGSGAKELAIGALTFATLLIALVTTRTIRAGLRAELVPLT